MGKVLALVGMGPGVSAAVARRFGREGFSVAALARRIDALKEQTDALCATGISARGYVADASNPSQLSATLAEVEADHGGIDVLVYNAAGVSFKPLLQLSATELMSDLGVSIGGALVAAQTVLPGMRKRGSGTLLFTGGGFAFEPMAAMASLGVGKAGIRNLAFSLFADLKDTDLHACTVTICGPVKPGTVFGPDLIADAYWKLHAQPKGSFERELMFK